MLQRKALIQQHIAVMKEELIMTVAALQESLGRAAAQVSPCPPGVPGARPAHAAAGRARTSCASW